MTKKEMRELAKAVKWAIEVIAEVEQAPVTPAEYLINLNEALVRKGREGVILFPPEAPHSFLAQCKLATDFAGKGNGFRFRAVFEEWSPRRIVRELY